MISGFLLGIGSIFIAMISFLLGRIFNQSEVILSEKRRVYEEFLRVCPMPNDAYSDATSSIDTEWLNALRSIQSVLMLYASVNVGLAISRYLQIFSEALEKLTPESEPLHPVFKELAKAQNDIVLEMRRDALGWSMFGYSGKSRLPAEALENAKRNAL